MIRDPSDGSVREPKREERRTENPTWARAAQPQSGLPPLESNDAARLKRSREQLENYKRTGVWK
jgi:hypothetical protein